MNRQWGRRDHESVALFPETASADGACPVCDFRSEELKVADVPVALSSLPRWWGHLFDSADDSDLRRRTTGDGWSALERGGHVRDVLHAKTNRLERLRMTEHPVLDEVQIAAPHAGDNDRDPEVVLVGLRHNAIRIVKIVVAMPETGWGNTGSRRGREMSALDLTREAVHDGVHELRAARDCLIDLGSAPGVDTVVEDIWGCAAAVARHG